MDLCLVFFLNLKATMYFPNINLSEKMDQIVNLGSN
jgi:hypothetical protein